jgi:SAM-dependent methyltransferase
VIEAAKALATGIDFRVGDAEALPFPDNHFDAVISTFGVMFARNPEAVAAELARVVRPGGRVSLANWAVGGSVHDMFKLIRSYKPAEENPAPSPFEWGKTARVLELLGDHFELEFEVGTSFFRPESGEKAWATFSTGFGPVVTLLEVLSEEKAAALESDFVAFHEAHRNGTGIVMRRPYVITKARRVSESKRAS